MAYIAPAGTPLALTDLVTGFSSSLFGLRTIDELRNLLSAHSGQAHCWPIASGRAAMTLILQAMSRTRGMSGTAEVLIPGYTCYSVPAAIERAGLKPRLVDIDPQTLGMDPDKLARSDFKNVVGIVTANLYGIPNALAEIETIAQRNGVFMLDDAAQSLGARIGGRAVGGFGDAGLYSFDKGKNITTFQGGAIVARSTPLARTIDEMFTALPRNSSGETFGYTIKLAAYGMLLRPTLYGMVQKMPGLGLGRTMYETRYPITQFSPLLAGLALRLARRLDAINGPRIANAERLEKALRDAPGIRLPSRYPNSAPVYARFPLIVNDTSRRDELIANLNRAGIGATASYPEALIDVPEVARALSDIPDQSGARTIARTIVTLPTHAYCPADLGSRVRAIVDRTLG